MKLKKASVIIALLKQFGQNDQEGCFSEEGPPVHAFSSLEDCRDSGELFALANAMYHDFIYRVHYARANPNYSHAIQKCCDYIEFSLERRIRTADLAALVGYTEYYLTERFKKETEKTITSYIRGKKIDRAKILFQTTELSIADIADALAFNTPNYFIQSFRKVTGIAPAQFRNRSRKVRSPSADGPQ